MVHGRKNTLNRATESKSFATKHTNGKDVIEPEFAAEATHRRRKSEGRAQGPAWNRRRSLRRKELGSVAKLPESERVFSRLTQRMIRRERGLACRHASTYQLQRQTRNGGFQCHIQIAWHTQFRWDARRQTANDARKGNPLDLRVMFNKRTTRKCNDTEMAKCNYTDV